MESRCETEQTATDGSFVACVDSATRLQHRGGIVRPHFFGLGGETRSSVTSNSESVLCQIVYAVTSCGNNCIFSKHPHVRSAILCALSIALLSPTAFVARQRPEVAGLDPTNPVGKRYCVARFQGNFLRHWQPTLRAHRNAIKVSHQNLSYLLYLSILSSE